jgi:hypothetical protein
MVSLSVSRQGSGLQGLFLTKTPLHTVQYVDGATIEISCRFLNQSISIRLIYLSSLCSLLPSPPPPKLPQPTNLITGESNTWELARSLRLRELSNLFPHYFLISFKIIFFSWTWLTLKHCWRNIGYITRYSMLSIFR